MSFTEHNYKIVYEKVLVVKSFHNWKDSLKKYENYIEIFPSLIV